MTRIVILGDSLAAICAAHHILDLLPGTDIQIITERAEIGLIGEVPGMISSWPPCSSSWISDMSAQTPDPSSTAVRASWFQKALGIQLSKRGSRFHLRTRVTLTSECAVHFLGAGPMGANEISFDHLLDLRSISTDTKQWYGSVYRTGDAPDSNFSGTRSDGTTEIWDKVSTQHRRALQEMTWSGENPTSFISDEVSRGKQLAEMVVDTIIHPVEQ